MRKVIAGAAVAGLILGAVSAVSAQEWSIGIGGAFSANLGGGYKYTEPRETWEFPSKTSTPYSGYGFDLLLAAKYAEASVGLIFNEYIRSSVWHEVNLLTGNVNALTGDEEKLSTINVNLGLWLKYPFNLSEAVKLFPIGGIEYEICGSLTSKDDWEINANDLSRVWFKAGVGSDIYLSERIYLHPVALYGIGWKSSVERSLVKKYDSNVNTKISHGPTVRLDVGYKFEAD